MPGRYCSSVRRWSLNPGVYMREAGLTGVEPFYRRVGPFLCAPYTIGPLRVMIQRCSESIQRVLQKNWECAS